jgi:arylsulfatase A-like enzyme
MVLRPLLLLLFLGLPCLVTGQTPPNIILIMTDDQGYGDFGFAGNPYVHTPTIDRLAREGTLFTSFYVSPVCAPTRSSLMTGRQSIKTGVYDTYNGGAIMDTREITIAEMLAAHGYATGIFGKWHLGDTYPNRPSDQGFQESLIHHAGGMAQVGDLNTYFEEDAYTDPVLWKNNSRFETHGYCSDVFTTAAINFISEHKSQPFFTYLSFNAPHTPLEVPDNYGKYREKDLDPSYFTSRGYPVPVMTSKDDEDARKIYSMVENIDDNIARLLKMLEENQLTNNTLIFFLTDNGPQQRRFTAGFRGQKGTVYEGGVRVPMIIYPRQNRQERINTPAAHIDILPTIMEICNIRHSHEIDGLSLWPLIRNEDNSFENRPIYHHWTRGFLTPYQNMAIRQGDFKLIGQVDYDASMDQFELYNLREDPFEQHNLIGSHPGEAEKLKTSLDNWIKNEVWNIKANPLIHIGNPDENPTLLNRNDAKGQPGIWAQDEIYGFWDVEVTSTGYYDFRYHFLHPLEGTGKIRLNLKPLEYTRQITGKQDSITLKNIFIREGNYRLETWYEPGNGRFILPFCIEVEKRE